MAKDVHPRARGLMGHLLAARPNEILAIDYTTLEPAQNGVENVLVLTDVFSKLPLWLECWYRSGFTSLASQLDCILTKVVILKAPLFNNCAICTAL